MPLSEILNNPPANFSEAAVIVVGIIGAILLFYSIFLDKERRRDAVSLIGSLGLFVYSLSVGNGLLTAAFAIYGLGNLIELILIATGKHQHVCFDCEEKKN
ncbi:MAG: hypothetical protein HW383_264 [Candidatus Magasanikbacteria bacterium]|nr:hypothetical protein [Candidatus Magasanikbacteria bacterium]